MASEAISKSFTTPLLTNQHQPPPQPAPPKKKRSLPGTPDPEAEVVALSPRTLLATNRFVCEICGKGFQRDQNLQLHRRGHNLPWKLRQRSGKEARKRVYVCPERGCVHHNPARALGDLTGIKKHFCRKHGEKKWKCDKCAKRYAVQSDWKAHAKTCGTREYRCDCGTLFSRRDSFITHRAFCDALAEETARLNAASNTAAAGSLCSQSYLFTAPAMALAPAGHRLKPNLLGGGNAGGNAAWADEALPAATSHIGVPQLYGDLFAPQLDAAQLSWLCGGGGKLPSSGGGAGELTSAVAAAAAAREAGGAPSLFSTQQQPAAAADMSATALLQKAAQIGATTSAAAPLMAGIGFESPAARSTAQAQVWSKLDAALYGASQATEANLEDAMNELAAANAPYGGVFAVARNAAGGSMKGGMGREETRDFLGVGMQALCSPSINGWI